MKKTFEQGQQDVQDEEQGRGMIEEEIKSLEKQMQGAAALGMEEGVRYLQQKLDRLLMSLKGGKK